MPAWWQVDTDLLRTIHLGMRRPWLDPWVVIVTFAGVGTYQGTWLLFAALRPKAGRFWLAALAVAGLVAPLLVEKSGLAVAASALVALLYATLPSRVAWGALWALVVSGALRLVLAELVDRPRPGQLPFVMPLENVTGGRSFPSGHTTTTFAIAAMVCWCQAKGQTSSMAAWTVLLALLVGVSRIYVGVHYPIDVLGGAVLGVAAGSACYYFLKDRLALGQERVGPDSPSAEPDDETVRADRD